jgi:benzoyl-CoA reductase subunit D
MVTIGMDFGAKNTKAVVLKNGQLLAISSVPSGFDQKASEEQALNEALDKAKLTKNDVEHLTVTGAGMDAATLANDTVTEITANARGISNIFPSVRTVIDIGAEEGRAIRLDAKGKVVDFGINEKCAAGAGAFTEAMARALELDIEEMGELSLRSTRI